MDDYYPDVTPDPNLAAVLRDRDVWKERAQSLETAIRDLLAGQQDLPRASGKVDADTVCFSQRLVDNLRDTVR